ncbi:NAD(P)H-hydrate dehydratase [Gramella sp. BOM4]|nr:NAD(P)H-hydrate dehydratase [Christiangramia bathymodioli]
MKILSAKQLSEADKISMEKQNITSEELMERAASLVFEEIHKRLGSAPIPIKVFCGIGNNGGDGLVVARKLIEHGYEVKVFIVNYSDKRSEDFLSNYDKLKEVADEWPEQIKGEDDLPEINTGNFIVDSIFGIGLNRPIEGWMAKLVTSLNESGAFILSVDMPSGLFPDQPNAENGAIIRADYTLSFQAPKIAFYLPESMEYVGDLQILDIGLDREFISKLESKHYLINRESARAIYKPRKKNTHKGDYGNVLIAGGSYGKIGSVMLTATAALRTGTGLCSLYIPGCGYEIVQTGLPEAMVLTDVNEDVLTDFPVDFEADVCCFGMGVGTEANTEKAFKKLLENAKNPLLIDADGLNILSRNKEMLELLPENSVLTPHPGELKRLIGNWDNDYDKLEKVTAFSKKYKLITVVKGAHTFTFQGDHIYVNDSGNPGMATAGSGDVLSGVITSLMGQSYDPLQAAVLGVYLHGLSGDIAAGELGYESLMAGEIARNIGKAVKFLFQEE